MTTRMTVAVIALGFCVLAAGCADSAEKRAAEVKAAAAKAADERATVEKKALEKKKVVEECQVLNMVLADWLKQGPDMGSVKDMNQAIVLMRQNLPNGYHPKVKGRRILVADQFVAKHSSYDQVVRLEQGTGQIVLKEGEDNIGPHCLEIDKIELQGDTGRVEISQNRRFNLGGSGGGYVLKRTDIGWTVRLTTLWMS